MIPPARVQSGDPAPDRPRDASVLLLLIAACALFIRTELTDPLVPGSAAFASGWWTWTDQARYLRAALAWASGDLSPGAHWYPPLYPLLGAAFVPLHGADPFLVPDFVCFLATGWLVARISGRLFPDARFAQTVGAAAFLLTDALSPYGVRAWVEPWTTTLATPLILLLLLGAIRLRERPTPGRAASCAVAWGLLLMTRPTEAVWVVLPAILFCASAIAFRDRGPARIDRNALACLGAAILAASITLALDAAIHLAIFGEHPGIYYEQSLRTGFEWSLLPIRFVSIVLSARPLHDEGTAMASRFPWVLPGLAGLLASFLCRGPARSRHRMVGGAVVLQWVVFLCYRDLHPEGLWRYNNYHYFKWTEPLLALYAAMLCRSLFRRRDLPAAIAGIVATLAVSAWRLDPVPLRTGLAAAAVVSPHRIVIPDGLTRPDQALLLASSDDFDHIYNDHDELRQAGRILTHNDDLKAWPIDGGFALAVVRPVPQATGTVELAPGTTARATPAPVLVATRLRFGLPCFILSARAACRLTALR